MTAAAVLEPMNAPVADDRISLTTWLAVIAGILGAFMASLDISITNSILPTIQGEIGANGSEGTWISTSFLVAEIVSIILSGWFERVFGLRLLLLGMVILFVCFSMLCGLATDLTTMVLGRVGQGFTGGVLVPTASTIISKRLSAKHQSMGFALFGFALVLGPIAGPLVGGLLTENLSWRYAFFINLPPGILLVALILVGLPAQPARLRLLRSADWLGIIGLVIGLGSLTVVLEDGHRELWFESSLIVTLCITALVGFALVIWGYRVASHPVVAWHLLRQRSFAVPVVLNSMMGFSFFGTIYLIPQFLAIFAGYNAIQIGTVVLMIGLPFLVLSPFFPWLIRTLDIRIAVMIAAICLGGSCLIEAALTVESSGQHFVIPQLILSVGMFFGYSFLNQAALGSVDKAIVEDAAAIFNCSRNLGGSIGLALVATAMDQRTTLHFHRLAENVTGNAPAIRDMMGGEQQMQGTALLMQQIQHQATVLAMQDVFQIMGVLLLCTLPLALLLTPLRREQGLIIL